MDESRAHLAALTAALTTLEDDLPRIEAWGARLATVLGGGGRLVAAGNGGSAAHAQHLAAELVGRYRDERGPLSAIALSSDGPTVTALANDYPADHLFARQVSAHGRAGDVFVGFSTSGRSPNVVAAVDAARQAGMAVWAVTGRLPNPLAEAADEALCVPAPATATVQEVHQVVIHLLCAALDRALLHH
jgi:D-sedoheptulose 7-phosphate isomerase